MTDHGLDSGAPSQLALDDSEDSALLSGDEDAARVLGIMAADGKRRLDVLTAGDLAADVADQPAQTGCAVPDDGDCVDSSPATPSDLGRRTTRSSGT